MVVVVVRLWSHVLLARHDWMSPLLQLPIHGSWLTVKVRVRVAMLRTDQTVGSSVTNARLVTVSGVTWTSFVCSHAFGYVSHGGVGSLSTGSPSGRGSGRSTSA